MIRKGAVQPRVLLFAIVAGLLLFAGTSVVRSRVTPAQSPGAPLLVLHGDRESGDVRAAKWRAAAKRAGWQVLALDCPSDLGCDEQHRWYMWNGNPSWVRQQVIALAERVRIDMSRVCLAGWSGGECPDRPFRAYFLVGDENPAHRGSVRLREYFERCKQDVKWDLLPGANHPLEDAALTPAKATEILRWLEDHRGRNAEV